MLHNAKVQTKGLTPAYLRPVCRALILMMMLLNPSKMSIMSCLDVLAVGMPGSYINCKMFLAIVARRLGVPQAFQFISHTIVVLG